MRRIARQRAPWPRLPAWFAHGAVIRSEGKAQRGTAMMFGVQAGEKAIGYGESLAVRAEEDRKLERIGQQDENSVRSHSHEPRPEGEPRQPVRALAPGPGEDRPAAVSRDAWLVQPAGVPAADRATRERVGGLRRRGPQPGVEAGAGRGWIRGTGEGYVPQFARLQESAQEGLVSAQVAAPPGPGGGEGGRRPHPGGSRGDEVELRKPAAALSAAVMQAAWEEELRLEMARW
jgi:hypothetical protein